MMDSENSEGTVFAPSPDVAEVWVEILAPLESARAVIAKAIQDLPSLPGGISVAASERGTILLNRAAWVSLHPFLKELADLQTRHSIEPVASRAIKFYVLT